MAGLLRQQWLRASNLIVASAIAGAAAACSGGGSPTAPSPTSPTPPPTTTTPPTNNGISGAEYKSQFEGLVFGTGQYGQATCPGLISRPSSSISTYNIAYSSKIPRANIDSLADSLDAIAKRWETSVGFNKTSSDSTIARGRGIFAINVVSDIAAACGGQTGITGCTTSLRENGEVVGIDTYIQEGSAGHLGLLHHEVVGHGYQNTCHVTSTLDTVMNYKPVVRPLDLKTQSDMHRAGVRAGDSRETVFAKMDAIGAFTDENARQLSSVVAGNTLNNGTTASVAQSISPSWFISSPPGRNPVLAMITPGR